MIISGVKVELLREYYAKNNNPSRRLTGKRAESAHLSTGKLAKYPDKSGVG